MALPEIIGKHFKNGKISVEEDTLFSFIKPLWGNNVKVICCVGFSSSSLLNALALQIQNSGLQGPVSFEI